MAPGYVLAMVVVTAGLLVYGVAELLVGGAALGGLHGDALLYTVHHRQRLFVFRYVKNKWLYKLNASFFFLSSYHKERKNKIKIRVGSPAHYF